MGTRTEKRVERRRGRSGTHAVIVKVGGGADYAREGVTPTDNQQLKPQDPTIQRQRRNMRMTRAQGREASDGIRKGGGGTTNPKRKAPCKSYRGEAENETWVAGVKSAEERALVQ